MDQSKQRVRKPVRSGQLFRVLFFTVLLAGLVLRFYHHLMGRSLWEDEAHIALNFMWFGYRGLMEPLQNYQTAPILFLWATETFCRLFGPGEISLRSFAFIVSIGAFPFFYHLVKELTGNVVTAIIAFTIFALNISLIYYSSEIKSYTVDVSMYVFILYLIFSQHSYVARHRIALLSIAGCIAILCSNASSVILLCAGLYLIASNWRKNFSDDRKTFQINIPSGHLVMFGSWLIVWLINFFKFIHKHPYSDGMKHIWSWTFVPNRPFSKEFADFMKQRIDDTIFTDMLFFSSDLYFPQMLTGLVLLAIGYCIYTRRWAVLWLTISPILLHMALSMEKLYPFFFRFILYLLPPFIIIVSVGISAVVRFIGQRVSYIAAAPVALFFLYCCTVTSIKKFPYWNREIAPVISFINDNYPDKPIIVTTPHTLYTYYMQRDIAKNKNLTPIAWQLKPDAYYSDPLVQAQRSSYLLLYSVNGWADGYGDVLASLQDNNLIVKKFEYKTYGIAEVKPKE